MDCQITIRYTVHTRQMEHGVLTRTRPQRHTHRQNTTRKSINLLGVVLVVASARRNLQCRSSLFIFSPFFVLTFISLKGERITHRVTQSSAKVFKRLKDEGGKTLLFVVIERFVFLSFFGLLKLVFFLFY